MGRVAKYLLSMKETGQKVHMSLIDPEKVGSSEQLLQLAEELKAAGTDVFLVGGSVGVSEGLVDEVIKTLKAVGLPVILFPGNVSGVSKYADAILFMSLLNSDDPYFIIGAHIVAAPIIRRYGIEPLPTAYIIIGYGGAAGFIGRARPIPYEKPELTAAHVLAARYLGMKFAYLEAGSGAPRNVPPEHIRLSKTVSPETFLIVGGGIRDPETARDIAEAGADAVVTGTIIERDPERAKRIIKAVKTSKP